MTTYRQFFTAVCNGLGQFNPTDDVLAALCGVVQTEGRNKYFNPFNIEWNTGQDTSWKGVKAFNSVGVQEYADVSHGVNATVAFLTRNSHWSTVCSRVRSNDGLGVKSALTDAYTWAAFHPAGSNASNILSADMGGTLAIPTGGKPSGAKPKAGSKYTVQTGDTLSGIAEDVYGDASKYTIIAKANKLPDPDLITVGQILTIPKAASASSKPPVKSKPSKTPMLSAKPTKGKRYKVKAGDTLWDIAMAAYGKGSYAGIAKANKLADPAHIVPGQILLIP